MLLAGYFEFIDNSQSRIREEAYKKINNLSDWMKIPEPVADGCHADDLAVNRSSS